MTSIHRFPAYTRTLLSEQRTIHHWTKVKKGFFYSKDQPTYPEERHKDRDARAPVALFPSCHEWQSSACSVWTKPVQSQWAAIFKWREMRVTMEAIKLHHSVNALRSVIEYHSITMYYIVLIQRAPRPSPPAPNLLDEKNKSTHQNSSNLNQF